MQCIWIISGFLFLNIFHIQTMELQEHLPPIWDHEEALSIPENDFSSQSFAMELREIEVTRISDLSQQKKEKSKNSLKIPSQDALRKNKWLQTKMLCPSCNKEFTKKEIVHHFKLSEQPLSCQFCELIFNGHLALREHTMSIHKKDIFYKERLSIPKLSDALSVFKFKNCNISKCKLCTAIDIVVEIKDRDLHIIDQHLRQKCPLHKCDFSCSGFLELRKHITEIHNLHKTCGEHDFKYITLLKKLGPKQ